LIAVKRHVARHGERPTDSLIIFKSNDGAMNDLPRPPRALPSHSPYNAKQRAIDALLANLRDALDLELVEGLPGRRAMAKIDPLDEK
jgi:hypothetical protein